MPSHQARRLGAIERHYCPRCDHVSLSHGAYTLHPCGAGFPALYAAMAGGTGATVWQAEGLDYAGPIALLYLAGHDL